MISAIITGATTLAGAWLNNKAEKAKGKHKLELAELENRARLMADAQSNNSDWEMASIRASGRAMRWASFLLFSLPILFTVIAPFFAGGNGAVATMWHNFQLVPDGWMTIYYAITGGIWGFSSLKEIGASPSAIVDAFKKSK